MSPQKLCSASSDEALSERLYQNWFKKFICGDFLLTDKKHPGRPVEAFDRKINEIVDVDRHITTKNIAENSICLIHILKNFCNKWIT